MIDDSDFAAGAALPSVDSVALEALSAWVREQTGAEEYYVFATSRGSGTAGNAGRQRLLLAFRTPDAALAFAQRNGLTSDERPRLRRLTLAQLIRAVLRAPAIHTLLVADEADDHPAGALPQGVRIERAALLRRLEERTS